MIISASYKTDIPAFYGQWFLNRLKAGSCKMVNPYGGQVYEVDLTRQAVDGFVFWSRNYAPFLAVLDQVQDRTFPFICHLSITGYPKALDLATIAPEKAAAQLHHIAKVFGPRVGVWRYDPIVFTSLTPPVWHVENFTKICKLVAGAVDEVVFSCAEIYKKTARNMGASAKDNGFDWFDPDGGAKQELLRRLAHIAVVHGLRPTLCAQDHLLVDPLRPTACVDAERLADVAGTPLSVVRKPHRKECGCWQSRDIGAYDTCPHGCVYCYAVSNRERAKQRFQAHDPEGEFLFPVEQKAVATPPEQRQGRLF